MLMIKNRLVKSNLTYIYMYLREVKHLKLPSFPTGNFFLSPPLKKIKTVYKVNAYVCGEKGKGKGFDNERRGYHARTDVYNPQTVKSVRKRKAVNCLLEVWGRGFEGRRNPMHSCHHAYRYIFLFCRKGNRLFSLSWPFRMLLVFLSWLEERERERERVREKKREGGREGKIDLDRKRQGDS